MPTDQIVTLGAPPAAPGRPEWLKDRIVEVVARGDQMPTLPWIEGTRWMHRPGKMPWHVVRKLVGGRVSTGEFKAAVDGLILDGRIIEVRLIRGDKREAPYLLIPPGRVKELPRPAAQAQGRGDVLAREPWARAIGAIN